MAISTTKSSDPGRARVEALLSLIMSTAQDAMKEYEKAGHTVPSPDSPHPLDAAYGMLSLKRSIRILDGACQQLCTTLAQPEHTMCNVRCVVFALARLPNTAASLAFDDGSRTRLLAYRQRVPHSSNYQ